MVPVCTATERSAKTAILDENLATTSRMGVIVNLLSAGGDLDRGRFLMHGLPIDRARNRRLTPHHMHDDKRDESQSDEGTGRQVQDLGKTAWIECKEEQPGQYDLLPLRQTVSSVGA